MLRKKSRGLNFFEKVGHYASRMSLFAMLQVNVLPTHCFFWSGLLCSNEAFLILFVDCFHISFFWRYRCPISGIDLFFFETLFFF